MGDSQKQNEIGTLDPVTGAFGQDQLTMMPGRGADAITMRLRHAIETGVYSDGDRLPPERRLATAFGAARSTIVAHTDDTHRLACRRHAWRRGRHRRKEP